MNSAMAIGPLIPGIAPIITPTVTPQEQEHQALGGNGVQQSGEYHLHGLIIPSTASRVRKIAARAPARRSRIA